MKRKKKRSQAVGPICSAASRSAEDPRTNSSDESDTSESEIVFRSNGGPSIFANSSLLEDALLRESIADCLSS